MPCVYQIFPESNLVTTVFFGRVTTRCVLRLFDEFAADPDFRDGMLEFDDLSRVEDLDISATDLSQFAELATGLCARRLKPTRAAMYAPCGPGRVGAYGFCKMVEGNSHFQAEAFDDLADAALFLGVSTNCVVRGAVGVEYRIN